MRKWVSVCVCVCVSCGAVNGCINHIDRPPPYPPSPPTLTTTPPPPLPPKTIKAENALEAEKARVSHYLNPHETEEKLLKVVMEELLEKQEMTLLER